MQLFSSNQSGRSMIEMLGVLAIIGVLSVGAIAGYSKAMMKYKLNKQAEQLNTLYSVAQQYVGKFHFNNASNNSVASTLYKLKLIPDEMVTLNKNGSISSINDVFGNTYSIIVKGDQAYSSGSLASVNGSIVVQMYAKVSWDKLSGYQKSFEMCQNMINVAKEYSDSFYYMDIAIVGKSIRFVGRDYCDRSGSYWQCIDDLTPKKIEQMCDVWLDEDEMKDQGFAVSWRP